MKKWTQFEENKMILELYNGYPSQLQCIIAITCMCVCMCVYTYCLCLQYTSEVTTLYKNT